MKKKISILGSTGSIGKTLINIINKDISNFEIKLLTAHKDHKTLLKQAKKFNVKYLIITDENSYQIMKKKIKNLDIKLFNNFDCLKTIFKKKIDYTMSAIIGLNGLKPTIDMIRFSKKMAIANKESIVCGWYLIKKELQKYKTEFLPVDSEHFSIWFALLNNKLKNIEKIYITASGGPFLNKSTKELKKIKLSEALRHPNWKMGKKISIDSATMMNKVFEIIEAKNIFDIKYNQLSMLTHPSSYIHAILKFNNGLTKIILHDTTMKIPIHNSLYDYKKKFLKSNKLNLKILNNLNLNEISSRRFPLIKIIDSLPQKSSLFETILVTANDMIVNDYLEGKISFNQIQSKLWNIVNNKEFRKFKRIQPKKIENIINLSEYVRLKINV